MGDGTSKGKAAQHQPRGPGVDEGHTQELHPVDSDWRKVVSGCGGGGGIGCGWNAGAGLGAFKTVSMLCMV